MEYFNITWSDALRVLTMVIYIAVVWQSYIILSAKRSSASTIAWLWAIFAFPFFFLPLYWAIGRVRIDERRLPKISKDFEFHGYAQGVLNYYDKHQRLQVSKHLKKFKKLFKNYGRVFKPYPNNVKLLINGESTFEAIFRSIRDAKSYIIIQYYIIQSDKLGVELKEILMKKATEGVQIYLLYDDMGSFWLSRQYIKDLVKSGVHVARFLPVASFRRFFLLNFRNHRKLVAVDGTYAYTGGLNVGEEYLGSRFKKQRDWRDTHLEIIGPAVQQLEEVFIGDWYFATGEDLSPALDKNFAEGNEKSETTTGYKLQPEKALSFAQVIPFGPTDKTILGVLTFTSFINSAKKRLWIATPYFIPDNSILNALELAVMRGVDVRLLIPRKGDHASVHSVTLSYAMELQKKGMNVYLYEKGFTHQKVFIIDKDLTSIGTSNLDNRGLYLNFELQILIHGKDFCEKTTLMLENDFSYSTKLQSLADHPHKRFLNLRANVARLLSPLL